MECNDRLKIIANKRLFTGSIILHILCVSTAIFVGILAKDESWDGWAIGVIIMFVVGESGAVTLSLMASMIVVINKEYVELKGIKGSYAKFAIDFIDKITDGIYFNGLYKCRAVRIILKGELPKFKKSLFFRGREILVEVNEQKISKLKQVINNKNIWE